MATAFPVCRTARQAKRAGPKLEAGPEASAERSEGTMDARQGRAAAGGSMRSTTARPAISQRAGDAQQFGHRGICLRSIFRAQCGKALSA